DRTQGFNSRHRTHLSLRLGIHTGTVAAGILGTQLLSYDLWGQPVAIASGLTDSTKDTNVIITTQLVCKRLEGFYEFQPGPSIALENQTKLDTWVLRKGALNDLIGELTTGLGDFADLDADSFESVTDQPATADLALAAPPSANVPAADPQQQETPQPTGSKTPANRSASSLSDLVGDLGIDRFEL
ncbi:MAG: adenylate/guanylate cyclase domain-containing protein, partial [Cyanobacteria bacterium P01_H01_bin.121]